MKTNRILGHVMNLEEGVRYIATRPIARREAIETQRFTISITKLGKGDALDFANTIIGGKTLPVMIIPGLTYDQANEFLSEFNNGTISLNGRIW